MNETSGQKNFQPPILSDIATGQSREFQLGSINLSEHIITCERCVFHGQSEIESYFSHWLSILIDYQFLK